MPFTALRSPLQAFNLLNALRKLKCNQATSSSSSAITSLPALPQLQRLAPSSGRRHASSSPRNAPNSIHIDGFEYGQSGLPIDLEVLISSRRPPRGDEWGEAIDSYLPQNLRLGFDSGLETKSPSTLIQSISTLPRVLAKAREQSKIDLLSYIGVDQGRWEAVIWLVKAMMEYYTGCRGVPKQSEQLLNMLWPSDGRSLDELTYEAIKVESPGVSRISLQSVMHGKGANNSNFVSWEHRCLGQIWRSLGTMILQAADRSPDDSNYSVIMFQVFRILGHLHHINAFPGSIYNYTPPADSTVLQRPPTLYLLSKRIMSTLSDVEFNLQWKEEILKYQEQGYELANTAVAPRIREFGPELWVDLVLWACVEGGWITEGAWIIGEMERRKPNHETRWSVISWQEICARKAPQLEWASVLRLQIDRTRLNQVGSIGIATGTDSTVDMGTRTISREVVLAIMDGLLNTGHDLATSNSSGFHILQKSLSSCKHLLEHGQSSLDPSLYNAAILRIVENMGVDGKDNPAMLQQILEFRPRIAKNAARPKSLLSAQNAETDDTAAYLGLLHRNLYSFAEEGNLPGTLAAIAKIIGVVDTKRSHHIEEFAGQLKESLHQADNHDDPVVSASKGSLATLSPQIPIGALTAFLELITESKSYDLGNWLLHNEDIDGGILEQKLYSNPNLQPALLRFATATADDKLLTKILTWIDSPIPEPVLHALLRCQIVLGKWSAVKELLQFFRNTSNMSWKASDAMAIAKAILRLEQNLHGTENVEQLSQAQELLSTLLHGGYNSPQDPSELPDSSQFRTANQLRRIFKTVPGSLKDLVTNSPETNSRANASVSITPNAFNILLESVVDCYGPPAGKQMWERWCRKPGEAKPKSNPNIKFVDGSTNLPRPSLDHETEKVVTPTQYMLRNILRPILQIRQHQKLPSKSATQKDNSKATVATDESVTSSSKTVTGGGEDLKSEPAKRPLTQEEQAVLSWGVDMFREFGLSAKEIKNEIPGGVPRRMTSKDVNLP